MLWCPILPERKHKFEMVMRALEAGWPGARCCYGMPPDDTEPVAVYGQIWGSELLLQKATMRCRPYYHIDNGWWRPGRGSPHGYYRFCYNGMTPVFLKDAPPQRARALQIKMVPWRKHGGHVLLGLPGAEYGRGIGLDMVDWIVRMREQLPRMTDRQVIVRDRKSAVPLEQHLNNCWAVVTHSSNIAVDAVTRGIPVFVSHLASTAPVGNLDLARLEDPLMPDREAWMNSLACQQFNVAEMRDGTAYRFLQVIHDELETAT